MKLFVLRVVIVWACSAAFFLQMRLLLVTPLPPNGVQTALLMALLLIVVLIHGPLIVRDVWRKK